MFANELELLNGFFGYFSPDIVIKTPSVFQWVTLKMNYSLH